MHWGLVRTLGARCVVSASHEVGQVHAVIGSPLRAGVWDPESCPGRVPGHQTEAAHSPERCWQDLKPTGFHGFGHREDTLEERRNLLPPLGGRSGSHSQSALPFPDPLTERGRCGFDNMLPWCFNSNH